MFLVLLIAFVVVPITEIYVIAQVAGGIGWLWTIALVILVSLVGAWLVRFQGTGVLIRAERRARAGEIPGQEIVDGILILLAGAFLLTPGFVTDGIGVLLLLPPVRALLRGTVGRRYRTIVATGRTASGFTTRFVRFGDVIDGEVIDGDVVDDSRPRPDPAPDEPPGDGRPPIERGDG